MPDRIGAYELTTTFSLDNSDGGVKRVEHQETQRRFFRMRCHAEELVQNGPHSR